MTILKHHLAKCDRQTVVSDTVELIDREVKSKSGISGMALKGGYRVIKGLRGGKMIPYACDYLLDSFTDSLSPLYEDYLKTEHPTFRSFLTDKSDAAAEALLSVTDKLASKKSDGNSVLRKTYATLRGQAKKHVVDAVPGLADIIDRHAPKDA